MIQYEKVAPQERAFGFSRSKHVLPAAKLKDVLNNSRSCGWHYCDDTYLYRRNISDELSDSYLILLTVSGKGGAKINDTKYVLEPNTALILPPNQNHSYYTLSDYTWEFYWIHLNGPECDAILSFIKNEYGVFHQINNLKKLTEYIDTLIDAIYCYFEYEQYASKTISRFLYCLLADISIDTNNNQLVINTISYIEKNYSSNIKLDQIASSLFVSKEHLIRVFKNEVGMTPYQYIKDYRLRTACTFLEETNKSINEIAQAVGFLSTSSFILQFRLKYQITPSLFRKKRTGV